MVLLYQSCLKTALWYPLNYLDGQVLEDLGDKNREAAMKWNEMSQEVKQRYQQLAAQLPSPSDNLFSYTVIPTIRFTTAFYNQIGQ